MPNNLLGDIVIDVSDLRPVQPEWVGLDEAVQLGPSPLQVYWDKVFWARVAHLEMMAAAFIKKTNLQPDECELVQESRENGEVVFYFRRRTLNAENS